MGLFHSFKVWRQFHGKVDWIYERFATLQSLGWVLCMEGVPWILETNGLFYYEAKTERKSIVLSRVARILELWAYRHCDVLICVTDELKALIVEEAQISPQKILVMPNGVDTEQFDPDRCTPIHIFDEPTIGFVGALLNWQRLDILLEALAELLSMGIEFNLVVVGDGPMQKAWKTSGRNTRIKRAYTIFRACSLGLCPRLYFGIRFGLCGERSIRNRENVSFAAKAL